MHPRNDTHKCRVVYFRVVDPSYPRNRRVRCWLEARGHDVVVVPPGTGSGRLRQHLLDLRRLWRASRAGDVIIVAEQYVRATPIAALVARLRGCRLVVDGFVGVHETAVDDWGVARPGSLLARRFRFQDRFALRSADCVLIDTDVRAGLLRAGRPRPESVITLPVGAPAWAVPQPERDTGGPLRILYYGNYIPLHGIDRVIRAIACVRHAVVLTLLGDGERRPRAERLAEELGVTDRLVFTDPVAEHRLASVVADHDVVLGVFGTSQKASTVIANKTWQGLACGRVVVTRRSPALAELLPIAGDQIVQVDVDAPQQLADALDRIAGDRLARDAAGRAADDVPHIAHELEAYVARRYAVFGAWLDGNGS